MFLSAALDGRPARLIVQATVGSLGFQLFDSFGVYPMNLQATITDRPAGWWWRVQREER